MCQRADEKARDTPTPSEEAHRNTKLRSHKIYVEHLTQRHAGFVTEASVSVRPMNPA